MQFNKMELGKEKHQQQDLKALRIILTIYILL